MILALTIDQWLTLSQTLLLVVTTLIALSSVYHRCMHGTLKPGIDGTPDTRFQAKSV